METSGQIYAAMRWLRTNPTIPEAVRESLRVPGKAFPDAVAEDPSRLVNAGKAVTIEAIRQDAPEGVVEGLMIPVRRATHGLQNLQPGDYAVRKLSEMQGLRDREELEAALTAALGNAPDDTNRMRLKRMIEAVSLAEQPAVVGEGLSDCGVCCIIFCGVCGIIAIPTGSGAVVACLLCCVASCLLCSY